MSTEDSQGDKSSSEDDPDWGSLEDSAATEAIDSDDDESSSILMTRMTPEIL